MCTKNGQLTYLCSRMPYDLVVLINLQSNQKPSNGPRGKGFVYIQKHINTYSWQNIVVSQIYVYVILFCILKRVN